jgi:hypothetical protein
MKEATTPMIREVKSNGGHTLKMNTPRRMNVKPTPMYV